MFVKTFSDIKLILNSLFKYIFVTIKDFQYVDSKSMCSKFDQIDWLIDWLIDLLFAWFNWFILIRLLNFISTFIIYFLVLFKRTCKRFKDTSDKDYELFQVQNFFNWAKSFPEKSKQIFNKNLFLPTKINKTN